LPAYEGSFPEWKPTKTKAAIIAAANTMQIALLRDLLMGELTKTLSDAPTTTHD
jgi:hypothetical protein